jgi:hypothetical protein
MKLAAFLTADMLVRSITRELEQGGGSLLSARSNGTYK